jgi:hypothetical protein
VPWQILEHLAGSKLGEAGHLKYQARLRQDLKEQEKSEIMTGRVISAGEGQEYVRGFG